MRVHRVLLIAVVLMLAAGCKSGEEATTSDGGSVTPIGAGEVNRYELEFSGGISMANTGGLICKVEEGDLVMDFSVDASDGTYEYTAVAPGFDATATSFNADFELDSSGSIVGNGEVQVTFGYGPAPAEYPGVVRAAGTIDGTLTTSDGDTDVAGSYACFLQEAEVNG
jgi:FlaG/FlaF family flagellin (archaellin)